MKNEKETRENLLKSAKEEFLEKGYMKASLRSICKNAGVTTGALYFFFKDKEDLFGNLVQKPLGKLMKVTNQHFSEETEAPPEILSDVKYFEYAQDIGVAKQIIHFLYEYQDEFRLILEKSQGSRFENCLDQIIEKTEKHYRILADKVTNSIGMERIEDYMIHWLSHMQVDMFVHLLTHEASEEAALKHIEPIIKYIVTGWYGMFSQKE